MHAARAAYHYKKAQRHRALAFGLHREAGEVRRDDEDKDVRVPPTMQCALSKQLMAVPFVVYTKDKADAVHTHHAERSRVLVLEQTQLLAALGGAEHTLLGGKVDYGLAVKIRAWAMFMTNALGVYDEIPTPRLVHEMRDVLRQYAMACSVESTTVPKEQLDREELLLAALEQNASVVEIYRKEPKKTEWVAVADQTLPSARGSVTLRQRACEVKETVTGDLPVVAALAPKFGKVFSPGPRPK